MQADWFYQSASEQAVPLFFVTKAQWDAEKEWTSFERNALTLQQFRGKSGDIGLMIDTEGALTKVYIGAGLGDREVSLASAANALPQGLYASHDPLSKTEMLRWALAQYRFTRYVKKESPIKRLVVNQAELPGLLDEVNAIFLVRDLINTPTNDLGPEAMSLVVDGLANEYAATYEAWIGDDLLKHNFPAIYAVGKGAAEAPRLLRLTWGQTHHPKVSVIGKGVCFDSGGLDLKPGPAMRLMKKDMGGAAHALGLAKWVMSRQLPIRLEVLIPAVENAIGPNAFRPGDVLTMRNGLTVEVDNTDAEGRLVLADAMTKAVEDDPELLIDFSTLTGAARVAVGTDIAAMFSNDDDLADALLESSRAVHDPMWRLPLYSGYESMLDSSIADLSNSNESSYAGAIVAALFLQRFVPRMLSWVHLDVMAWNVSNKPGKPVGGEALGLRAVADYLLNAYGQSK